MPGCLPTGHGPVRGAARAIRLGETKARPRRSQENKHRCVCLGPGGRTSPLPPARALLGARGRRKPAGLSGPRGAGEPGSVRERPRPAPPPPAGCAPGPAPSPGFPRALSALSLCLRFSSSGAPVPTLSRLSRSPRPGPPLPFNFLLSRGENFAREQAAARRRYWPAPRPAAPPPAPALPSAPHSQRERRRRRRRSLRGRACVCECAPASGSVCVCAPGAGWAALAPRQERREPGGRVVTQAGEAAAAAAGPGRGWGSGGRAGHGAGKPALRQDAPASSQREALGRPARGLPGRAGQTFLSLLPSPEVKSRTRTRRRWCDLGQLSRTPGCGKRGCGLCGLGGPASSPVPEIWGAVGPAADGQTGAGMTLGGVEAAAAAAAAGKLRELPRPRLAAGREVEARAVRTWGPRDSSAPGTRGGEAGVRPRTWCRGSRAFAGAPAHRPAGGWRARGGLAERGSPLSAGAFCGGRTDSSARRGRGRLDAA